VAYRREHPSGICQKSAAQKKGEHAREGSYAERLVVFLNDPDVDGQVLDTLIKMKAPSYPREVGVLLQSDKAGYVDWPRNTSTATQSLD
jgi:hypothetical protein